jgi:hypothetical protein
MTKLVGFAAHAFLRAFADQQWDAKIATSDFLLIRSGNIIAVWFPKGHEVRHDESLESVHAPLAGVHDIEAVASRLQS